MLVFACICLSRLFGLFILFLHPALTNDSVCWACRTYTHINLLNITRSLTRIISMRWLMLMMKLLPLPLPLPLVHVTSLRCVCASLSLLSLGVRCELEMAMKAQSSCCWLCVRCVYACIFTALISLERKTHSHSDMHTRANRMLFIYKYTKWDRERKTAKENEYNDNRMEKRETEFVYWLNEKKITSHPRHC